MSEYPDSRKIKDALQVYFSKYHFVDGGYTLKYFKIKVGPVYIPVPNNKGRIAAVKIHDIHHLLTEYKANLKGEAQIGGWEIASGCGRYMEAWILNFGSFMYGLFFFPGALFQAFMKGRAVTSNLYHSIAYNDTLLNKTVGELRESVGINNIRKNNARDYLLFVVYAFLSLTAGLMFLFFLIYLFINLLLNADKSEA